MNRREVLGMFGRVAAGSALLPGLVACGGAEAVTRNSTPEILPPVRIAVVTDKSRSVLKNGIEQPDASEFRPLIDLLKARGGDLAVGFILDHSDVRLERLSMRPRPLPPMKPSDDLDAFDLDHAMQEYARAMHAFREANRERDEEAEVAAEAFLAAIDPLLRDTPHAGRTDIWKAVARVGRFMGEPVVGPDPTRFAVLVSDCEDNVGAPQVGLPAGTRIAVVHGATDLGTLASLDPVSFEAFYASVEWVIQTAGAEEHGR